MVRATMRVFGLLTGALLVFAGCGGDDPATVGGATESGGTSGDAPDDDDDDDTNPATGESASASAGSLSSGAVDDGGNADSTGEDDDEPDTGEDLPPPPATGVEIVHVTADQGVRVPIVLDSQLVDGSQRSVALFKNRGTMIRAFYELDPGFESRDIYGILYVQQTDGTITEHGSFVDVFEKDCTGQSQIDCRYGTLPNSFFWAVPPEEVQPGMTYRIELFETAPGHEDDVSDKSPNFPAAGGSMVVGVEDSYMKMRVVLVPFDHDLGPECPEPPEIGDPLGDDSERTVSDFFAERLLAQNPVDEVEIIQHEVVRYTGSLRNANLLGTLQQLRFQEGAPPEYYYYGVARPCDGGPDFAGVAQLGGPTVGQAGQRVGWGVYYSNVGTTAETFVHEIGHEQGRSHIACNGEEAGVDPSYPDHPNGDLLNYGIDVFSPTSFEVHTPSTHDYMTYCSDTWVSEWAYNKVVPWIAEMSSWELSDAVQEPKVPLLVGTVRADGTESWYTTVGFAPTERSERHMIRFDLADGTTVETPAMWTNWERSDDVNVIVPLPAAMPYVSSLAWSADGIAHPIDRSTVSALSVTLVP